MLKYASINQCRVCVEKIKIKQHDTKPFHFLFHSNYRPLTEQNRTYIYLDTQHT